jgi:hypothetical protein
VVQKVLVQLVDDLDGTTPSDIETVLFALDGVSYEIDLGPKNASELRHALGEFVGSARRTGGRIKRGTASKTAVPDNTGTPGAREQTKAVREWARSKGYELSDRGRIPANIVSAFEHAHARSTRSRTTKSAPKSRPQSSREKSSSTDTAGTTNGTSGKAATPSFSG